MDRRGAAEPEPSSIERVSTFPREEGSHPNPDTGVGARTTCDNCTVVRVTYVSHPVHHGQSPVPGFDEEMYLTTVI